MASKTLTIEVGNEFIKICEMQVSKGNVMVHNAISVQTPYDSVEDGLIRDISQVAGAIRGVLTEESITANEVTFVLNSSRVATKEVILPLVKASKLQELVNINASEYFPVNIDDYVLSYTVLEEKKSKDEQKSRLLVFAAPELMVQSYFDLARTLGMKVKAVDYAGNSTLQLIRIQIDEKPTMVVQLGMDTTIVSVMNNNVLQLQRTIPYGESLLLNQVMDTRNVKAKVAMELLASAQIVKDSLDADETTGSLKYLISNVNRVIEYYSSRNQNTPLQKIVIIGEGADVLGMDVLFANETSLPAERLTVLKKVESYNRIKVSTSLLKQYMANIGATLNPIHLEPKAQIQAKQKPQVSKSSLTVPCAVGMVVMFAIAAGMCIVPMAIYNSKKSDRDDYQNKINALKPKVEEMNQAYTDASTTNSDAIAFDTLTSDDSKYALDLINFLETNMPADMGIDSFSITNGQVSLSLACGNNTEIIDIMNKLEEDDHYYDVKTTGYTVSGATTENPTAQTLVSSDITFNIYGDPQYDDDGNLVEEETSSVQG